MFTHLDGLPRGGEGVVKCIHTSNPAYVFYTCIYVYIYVHMKFIYICTHLDGLPRGGEGAVEGQGVEAPHDDLPVGRPAGGN